MHGAKPKAKAVLGLGAWGKGVPRSGGLNTPSPFPQYKRLFYKSLRNCQAPLVQLQIKILKRSQSPARSIPRAPARNPSSSLPEAFPEPREAPARRLENLALLAFRGALWWIRWLSAGVFFRPQQMKVIGGI